MMKIFSNIELIEKYQPQNVLNDIKEHFIMNKSKLFDLFSKSSCPISKYKVSKQLSFIEVNKTEDQDFALEIVDELHDASYFMSLSKKNRTIITQRMRSFAVDWTIAHINRIKLLIDNGILELPFESEQRVNYSPMMKELNEVLICILSGLKIELDYWQKLPRASYLSGLQVSMGNFFRKLNQINMSQKDQITLVQQLFSLFDVDWDEGARGNIKNSLQQPSLEILVKRKSSFDNPIGLEQENILKKNNLVELLKVFYTYRDQLRRF